MENSKLSDLLEQAVLQLESEMKSGLSVDGLARCVQALAVATRAHAKLNEAEKLSDLARRVAELERRLGG